MELVGDRFEKLRRDHYLKLARCNKMEKGMQIIIIAEMDNYQSGNAGGMSSHWHCITQSGSTKLTGEGLYENLHLDSIAACDLNWFDSE